MWPPFTYEYLYGRECSLVSVTASGDQQSEWDCCELWLRVMTASIIRHKWLNIPDSGLVILEREAN